VSEKPLKLLHASCVSINEIGVLLRGPSGSGKSDLTLRLIGDGAILVADDQVQLKDVAGSLMAKAPDMLAGKLEVRGCGILAFPRLEYVTVRLVIDLVPRIKVQRLPGPASCQLFGFELPLYHLHAFDSSCSLKIIKLSKQVASNGR
jgi:HPr kinase/phosphorylase